MDAIQKIEAALAGWDAAKGDYTKVTVESMDAGQTFSYDCNPAAIREVLQTLASKEAELAAREAEIANQALNYVSLFGELQNAMAEIERVRSLTDAQIDDLWIRRDCIEAIQAGDICAQVRCVVRAALTTQPPKELK